MNCNMSKSISKSMNRKMSSSYRLRIEGEDSENPFLRAVGGSSLSRGRRQLATPKEISIQVSHRLRKLHNHIEKTEKISGANLFNGQFIFRNII